MKPAKKQAVLFMVFVAVIMAVVYSAIAEPVVETWPVSGGDDVVTVACAPLAGWYAIGDSYDDNIEIRNIEKELVRTITRSEIKTLLPWMILEGGTDGPCGLAWSDSGRVLFILVYDDTSPGDGRGSDAVLRYDTFTDQLSVFTRLDLWWHGNIWPLLSAVHFSGRLYVGTWSSGIKVYKAQCDDANGVLMETVTLPAGYFVHGLCIDREANILYAASESGLFHADLNSPPLILETIDDTYNYRAITYSSHYGFGLGLYYLNDANQVYHVPPAQARGEKPFDPSLYWTTTVSSFDIEASADGHLLVGLDENAAWISDDNDERLGYEEWKADEFAQLVMFCKGLISPDGEPPGWVIDADVDSEPVSVRFHPASPDGAMWVILVLMMNDHINEDVEAMGLVRQILKRYAGLADDGIVPVRSADGFYHHWYEPATGETKCAPTCEPNDWTPEIAVLSTMKIVLAADRASQFYPDDLEIQEAANSIISKVSNWEDYIEEGTDCLFLRGMVEGGPEPNSQVCPFFEGILYLEQAATYGEQSAVDSYTRWLDRVRWPTAMHCSSCGPVTVNTAGQFQSAFVSLYPFLLQPDFRNDPNWQSHIWNLLCSSAAWTDDNDPCYYTVFSAGTADPNCDPCGYHADSLSDHPCDVATFPSLIGFAGWSTEHPHKPKAEAATVAAYNAYRRGGRQAFKGIDGIHPEILYRRPKDLSWQPNSAGLPDVALSALALGELLLPGTIDTIISIPYSAVCVDRPVSDLDEDCRVNFKDFEVFAEEWRTSAFIANDVIITCIMDGTMFGGTPKVIELYISGTVDLSSYTIQRSSDGGPWSGLSVLSGTFSDTFAYLIGSHDNGEVVFDSMFGTTGIFANRALVSGAINGNGNDCFRIMNGSTVVDQVWEQNDEYVYRDSYMYRMDGTGPDGGWVADNWYIPGNGVLDGLSEEEQAAAVPMGSYVFWKKRADFNKDRKIDFLDLAMMVFEWLDCNLDPPDACWE